MAILFFLACTKLVRFLLFRQDFCILFVYIFFIAFCILIEVTRLIKWRQNKKLFIFISNKAKVNKENKLRRKKTTLKERKQALNISSKENKLQLNTANVSDAEASFSDLHLSISDGFVKTKIYDKRDDFDFDIVNFPFLDGDVPRSASYGVYISQLIRFARVSSHIDDFNTRNKILTAKLLRQ